MEKEASNKKKLEVGGIHLELISKSEEEKIDPYYYF